MPTIEAIGKVQGTWNMKEMEKGGEVCILLIWQLYQNAIFNPLAEDSALTIYLYLLPIV